MYQVKKKSIIKRVFSGRFLPMWLLGVAIIGALAASGAGGAVGAVLTGVISGNAGLTIEKPVVIDKENLSNLDFKQALKDANIAVSDDGTKFTIAAEMYTGDDLVFDLPLANRSGNDMNMIARLDTNIPLQDDIEVFWNTPSRSDSPTITNSTPTPAALTQVAAHGAETYPSTSTLPGVAEIGPQILNGTATNSGSTGLPDSTAQTTNATRTTTKPTGASTTPDRISDGTLTTTLPTGSVGVSAQTSNGSVTTTQPSGGATVSVSSINLTNSTTTAPSGAVSITATTSDASTKTTTQPTGSASNDANNATTATTTTQPSGSASVTATTFNTMSTFTQFTGSAPINAQTVSVATSTQPTGATGTTTSSEITFSTSTILSSGNVGTGQSIYAVDANTIYVSYREVTNKELEFAKTTNGGTTWTTTLVDTVDEIEEDTSIFAVDADTIYISYRIFNGADSDLRFAKSTNGGTTWSTTDIDTGDNAGFFPSIVAIDEDTIYVSYQDLTDNDLLFAKSIDEGATWATSTVDTVNRVGRYTSIAAVDANTIYISHQNFDTDDLRLAKSTNGGGSWSLSNVKTTDSVGKFSSIEAVDADTVYISYYNETGLNIEVARSTNGGSSWSFATVDSTGDVGQYTSIATVDAQTVYVSYYDVTNTALKFASSTDSGATWFPSTVDSDNNVGLWTSIAAVDKATVYISYYDATGGDLEFAKSAGSLGTITGSNFSVSTVDSAGNTGNDNTIVAIDANTIYISYRDEDTDDVVFAKSTDGGSTFATSTAASGGEVGLNGISMDAVDADTIFISYYHFNTADAGLGTDVRDLGFAKSTDGGSTWATTTVATRGTSNTDVGQGSSIKAVDANTIFISHANAANGLEFAKSTDGGSTWATSTVPNAGSISTHTSLSAVDANTLYIAYFDFNTTGLTVAKSVDGGSTWATTSAATVGNVGVNPSIVAVDADTVYVAHYDQANGDLEFAKSTDGGSTWATTTVESTGTVGSAPSITAVDAQTIYIVHNSSTEGFRFSKSTDGGSTWSNSDVSGGSNALHTSVVAVDADTVYASYYENSTLDLKFAKGTVSSTGATWYSGTFTLDSTGSGGTNTVNFVLIDLDSDGDIDRMEISSDDAIYGEGSTSNDITGTDNDEIFDAGAGPISSDAITIGTFSFTTAFTNAVTGGNASTSVTSRTWHNGFLSIDSDHDASVDDSLLFVLSDTDSNGVYETVDISLVDATYGEGNVSNSNVDIGDDERTTNTSSDIVYGGANLTFTTTFVTNPATSSNDFTITSKTFFTGSETVALDTNGTVDDTINYVLTDTDSNGTYDTLDISQSNTTFGEVDFGTLSDSDVDPGDDERITSSSDIVYGTVDFTFTTAFVTNPATTTNDVTLTSKTWFTGSFPGFAIDGDGLLNDTINFALSDVNSDGAYDGINLSVNDTDYNDGTTNDKQLTATDDEQQTSGFPVTDLQFGAFIPFFSVDIDSSPLDGTTDATITARTRYTGSTSVSLDGGSTANDTLNFVLTDSDSNGTWETLEISQDDTTYGASTGNTNVDSGDDERITATTTIVYGAANHTFVTGFDSSPSLDTSDVRLVSGTWYTGTFSLALDSNGVVNDTVNWALTDSDSNGVFDTLDLSQGDTTYGVSTGNTNVDTGDDERITSSTDIVYGSVNHTFTTTFNGGPATTTSDASVTSKSWYTGSFGSLRLDTDGVANDTLYWALTDIDSDGDYDTIDLSLNNTTFGETTGGTLTDNDIDSSTDDERTSTSGTVIDLGSINYAHGVNFDNNPPNDTSDVRLSSNIWYTGSFTIDADADAAADDTINFFLTDIDGDGDFDLMDLSLNNTTYGETTGGTLTDLDMDSSTDDERISGTSTIEIGSANYSFITTFGNVPEAGAIDASITAITHFEGSFNFDADANGSLAASPAEVVYWGLSDLDSNGLYDNLDMSLADQNFADGTLTNSTTTSPAIGGSDDDERITTQAKRVQIGTTYTVKLDFATNPAGTTTDLSALLVENNTPLKFFGIPGWIIDADGDLDADDHVYFVLSDTDSNGIVDTMDISITDLVFGEGTLGNGTVDFGAVSNSDDERITGDSNVQLGVHTFLVQFQTDVYTDDNDAQLTARWYVGTQSVDIDNDRTDNTLDFVIVDHNSDGLYTVFELDGDDSGHYSAGEVHHGAASSTLQWFDPVFVEQSVSNSPNPNQGQFTSIDAVSRDLIYISYYDVIHGNLKFSKSSNTGETWDDVEIDATGDVGQYTSIEAVSASDVYISYYDVTNGDLKFASSTDGGSTWTTATLDSTGDVGKYSSISATSSGGVLYIAYFDETNDNLKIARSTNMGGMWTLSTIDSTGDVGRYASLDAVHSLSTTTVAISYYDATNGDLKFASTTDIDFATLGFQVKTVDSVGDVGQYSSVVAVNDTTSHNGHSVYISYYDASNANLLVATSTNSGGTFATTTAVSTEDVGKFSSIAAEEPTTIFISYFHDAAIDKFDKIRTVRSLDYGVTWEDPVTVEEAQTVGKYNDIALYGTSNVYVSYYDERTDGTGHLKFAKSHVLLDLQGHRLTLDWSMNPANASNSTLYDGRILNIAQLNKREWLFIIPAEAGEGPSIEQTQLRIRLRGPNTMVPGYYTVVMSVREYEG